MSLCLSATKWRPETLMTGTFPSWTKPHEHILMNCRIYAIKCALSLDLSYAKHAKTIDIWNRSKPRTSKVVRENALLHSRRPMVTTCDHVGLSKNPDINQMVFPRVIVFFLLSFFQVLASHPHKTIHIVSSLWNLKKYCMECQADVWLFWTMTHAMTHVRFFPKTSGIHRYTNHRPVGGFLCLTYLDHDFDSKTTSSTSLWHRWTITNFWVTLNPPSR